MRRLWVFVAVAAVAVVALATPAVAQASTSKPVALTPALVAPAMLALEDMPDGWTATPNGTTLAPGTKKGGICNGPDGQTRALAAGGGSVAVTSFYDDPQEGPYISEVVYGFPTAQAATKFIAAFAKVASHCKSGWKTEHPSIDGATVKNTIAPLSAKKLGDQVAAARQTATVVSSDGEEGPPGTLDSIYTRLGNNVIVVNRSASGTDKSELLSYTKKALAKFNVLLQQAK